MEDQEQTEPVTDLDNFYQISFDGASRDQLKQIALWARICSIAGLVGYLIQLYEWLFGRSQLGSTFSGGLLGGLFNICLIGGGGFVNYFLFRFAVSVSRGVQNTDALHVNSGFNSLRRYFRAAGILVIVMLCLVVIAFLRGIWEGMHGGN